MIVFFCYGFEIHSIMYIQSSGLELSSHSNNDENKLYSDTDSSEEELMELAYLTGLQKQPEFRKSDLLILTLFDNLLLSIWQPPKVSQKYL
jgi:hypothetical protein